MTVTAWDWEHEIEARRSDAYGAGLRDGKAAFEARRPVSSCDPADWDERYAANYRNGGEHAYHGARRDAATRANHCAQAQAGYWYCEATHNDPCGPGRYPHRGHVPGQCDA